MWKIKLISFLFCSLYGVPLCSHVEEDPAQTSLTVLWQFTDFWMYRCLLGLSSADQKYQISTKSRVAWTIPSIYLINNPGCKILNIDPFNQEVMKLGKSLSKIDCLALTVVAENIIRINETTAKEKYNDSVTPCSYESIQRVSNSDRKFHYGQPVGFIKYAELLNADEIEFVRVKCYNKINESIFTDFHAIVSKKTEWMLCPTYPGKCSEVRTVITWCWLQLIQRRDWIQSGSFQGRGRLCRMN